MPANHVAKLESKFRHAFTLHQQGKRKQAGKLYRTVLKSRPDHSGALHYLGLLSHQEGNSKEAIRLMRSALRQQPDNFDAMMNLGNVYQEQEQFSEATECYRKAIELRPTEAAALSNLSVSLRRQEHLKEAIEAGLSAVALDPEYLIAWYNLGNAYKVAQRFKSAITSYQKAIELKPDLSLAHDGLCQSTFQLEHRSLFGRASFSKTKKAYEQWLACEPDNALAQFMLEAIGGKSRLLRAPDAVVRNMFDQFAPSFETHLQSLNYRLPQMLTPLLEDLLGPPQASVKIVDGGCGTGLCAAALKPWARSLTGVDLSTAMLEKARQKALYDALFEAELTTFMQQHDGAFDLAVYADTLCYFGDLQDILHATAEALDDQGTLLLTLEASAFSQDVTRYQLQPQGRYTHSPSYVENTLQACGFAHILIRSDSTRTEVGRPVDGLLVSARKP